VSGLHHVELRPRSLRYYTTERPQRLYRKQTLSGVVGGMSALPPKAICNALALVRFAS
jgi:hypothetical protein